MGIWKTEKRLESATVDPLRRIGKLAWEANPGPYKRIFEEIDSLEKSEVEQRTIIEAEEFFQWPAAAAALFALLGLAWEIGRGRVAPEYL